MPLIPEGDVDWFHRPGSHSRLVIFPVNWVCFTLRACLVTACLCIPAQLVHPSLCRWLTWTNSISSDLEQEAQVWVKSASRNPGLYRSKEVWGVSVESCPHLFLSLSLDLSGHITVSQINKAAACKVDYFSPFKANKKQRWPPLNTRFRKWPTGEHLVPDMALHGN